MCIALFFAVQIACRCELRTVVVSVSMFEALLWNSALDFAHVRMDHDEIYQIRPHQIRSDQIPSLMI